MKFAGVIFLGLVAAVCMAGLMVFLPPYFRGPTAAKTGASADVQILVAAKSTPAMKVVDADSVSIKTVRRQDAPENFLSDPVQVVGKVLLVPMTAGQAFTKKYFAPEGSGLHVASTLPNGMRAIGVSLADYSGLEGLLYPGCMVDVLASFRPVDGTEAISKTLLQNVQVLSIENATIVSTEETKRTGRNENNRRRMVTLMVDPDQAKSLQAAMQEGTISLSMRNPLDAAQPVADAKEEPNSDQTGWEVTILRGRKPETMKFRQFESPR